jgi:hypothetical protein
VVIYDGSARVEKTFTSVALALSGLSASTVYYFYACWTGSALALEASTTAPAFSAALGALCKGGGTPDPTRLYLGVGKTEGTAVIKDLPGARNLASFWHPEPYEDYQPFTSASWSVAGAFGWTALGLTNAAEAQHFFVAAADNCAITAEMTLYGTTNVIDGIGYNGATPARSSSSYGGNPNFAGYAVAFFCRAFARGGHYLQCYNVCGSGSAGTGFGNNGSTADPTSSFGLQSGWRVSGRK